ncbi:hypothetical protein [Psychroserpens sp. NJDZ02]|uniref:hypothetical protein n=1 Tax=Psychroserpens sp. NJDZ02 TaxID=2570561 RepID=UPI0010A80E6F|nr:hypothetical protein [Psychroserpens sp. NJDZ02]QCE42751.1 hypothetical protein E9099_15480 [Psychroserpens sp. NJDZ02]
MKNYILGIFLVIYNFAFSQIKKDTDTISLFFNEIIYKTDTIHSTRTKSIITKKSINKQYNKPLNGLYKVITGNDTFFITKYKEGLEDNKVFNYVKYYYKGKLFKIEVKGIQIIGTNYISIPKYNCKNTTLQGNYIDITNDKIVEPIKIKQRARKKHILWKIKSKNGTSCIRLNRKIFTDCY